ncbi:MAG: PIN domain-containing protein [Mycobacteriaceae bacterium]
MRDCAVRLRPETALDVVPLGTSVWRHFEALPASISDPADGLIVSAAQALGVPLVTKDGRITGARVVEVIW